MPSSHTPQWNLNEINGFLRAQEARKTARVAELARLLGSVPTSDTLVREVSWLGPSEREEVLRGHPGRPIKRKLESLWSMLDAFELARADLLLELARFHRFSGTPEMDLPAGRAELRSIEGSVRKELLAFSASAAALVQLAYRVRDAVLVPELAERVTEGFDAEEHAFVTALRNILSHQEFPSVNWRLTYAQGQQSDSKSDFTVSTSELLADCEMKSAACAYLVRMSPLLGIRQLVESYGERVAKFYLWYRAEVERRAPEALIDYGRIERACLANASRTWHRIILGQLIARKVDPYPHLNRYLLPGQVEHAEALPHRSREQIDFIIRAADEYGACDDELRGLIYKLFSLHKDHSPPE